MSASMRIETVVFRPVAKVLTMGSIVGAELVYDCRYLAKNYK